jgi:hypothetical protein
MNALNYVVPVAVLQTVLSASLTLQSRMGQIYALAMSDLVTRMENVYVVETLTMIQFPKLAKIFQITQLEILKTIKLGHVMKDSTLAEHPLAQNAHHYVQPAALALHA